MNYCYNGIGEISATFGLKDGASIPVGAPVKMTGYGEVAACENGDEFIGFVESCRGGCVAVQLCGCVEAVYSGAEPAAGYVKLVADGAGGICAGEGREYLVMAAANGAAEIML